MPKSRAQIHVNPFSQKTATISAILAPFGGMVIYEPDIVRSNSAGIAESVRLGSALSCIVAAHRGAA